MMKVFEDFTKILEEILDMDVGTFIKAYRDTLPDYEIVHEDTTIEELFEHMAQGRDYIIIVDSKGRLRGAITYLDILMYIGRHEHRVLTTALGSIRGTLTISRIPSETLAKMKVSILMKRLPPHVSIDHSVREALNIMENCDTHYTVVQTKDGAVVGIITMHAIFRAAMEKLRRKSL